MIDSSRLRRCFFAIGGVLLTLRAGGAITGGHWQRMLLECALALSFGTGVMALLQPAFIFRWRSWSFLPVVLGVLFLSFAIGQSASHLLDNAAGALEQVWIPSLVGGIRLVFVPGLAWDERVTRWFALAETGVGVTLLILFVPPVLAPLGIALVVLAQGLAMSIVVGWGFEIRMRRIAALALAGAMTGALLLFAPLRLRLVDVYAMFGWLAAWLGAYSCEGASGVKYRAWFAERVNDERLSLK